MANEWEEVTVEEIKADTANALVTGPFGSSIGSRFFRSSGVPVIRGSNLSEDVGVRFNDSDLVFLTPEKAAEFQRCVARRGDLVFTCWGTINQVGLLDDRCKYTEYVLSNKQMKLTPDGPRAHSLFLYYLFSGPEMQGRILGQAIGSSVPGFNLGQLRSIEIRLPPLAEQRTIARILGTLDDKIELIRRMNRTLEALARALFQSWFVDFEPVTAKAAGRKPVAMTAETASLFPDTFENSSLGPIPKGWSIRDVYAIARVAYGAPFASQMFNTKREGKPLLRIRDLADHNPEVYTTEEHPKAMSITQGDIVVGMDGEFRAHIWRGPDSLLNQRLCKFIPLQHVPTYFVLFSIEDDLAEVERTEVGTTVIHLGKADIDRFPVLTPLEPVLAAYARFTTPLLERLVVNGKQLRSAAALRDALLPRLLSGELRVKDAEKMVETA